MNIDTELLLNQLHKNYLTLDDVRKYGKRNKVYLISQKDGHSYWFFNGINHQQLKASFNKNDQDDGFIHRLFIIGNGFDLSIGLPTTYENFFNYRFGVFLSKKLNKLEKINYSESFEQKLSEWIEECEEKKDWFKTLKNQFNFYRSSLKVWTQNLNFKFFDYYDNLFYQFSFTRWDCVFLLCRNYLAKDSIVTWSDVENIIFDIITIIFGGSLGERQLKFKDKNMDLSRFKLILLNLFSIDNPELINKYNDNIRSNNNIIFTKNDKNKLDSYVNTVYKSLQEFEKNFAEYINLIVGNNDSIRNFWYERAKNEFDRLLDEDSLRNKKSIVDVISFNYSLDKRFYDWICNKENQSTRFKINSWTNIHGTAFNSDPEAVGYENTIYRIDERKLGLDKLPQIIFGIDSHDILGENINLKDLRLRFTKAYRLVEENVNSTRYMPLQNNINYISIVGHSLSKADYSYFEELFDQFKVYDVNSNTNLEYFYYKPTDVANIISLLIDYGYSLKNTHGENIIDTMVLNQKLVTKKTPQINFYEPLPLDVESLKDIWWLQYYLKDLYNKLSEYQFEYRIDTNSVKKLISLLNNLKSNRDKILKNNRIQSYPQESKDFITVIKDFHLDCVINKIEILLYTQPLELPDNIEKIQKIIGDMIEKIENSIFWKHINDIKY